MTRYDDNPWKGLNFYVEGESLFGRDLEIRTLAQYIINNSQTVLYGESGIGKSSIVNAGIFPIARQQGLHPVPLRLEHDQENCQGYLSQIKHAFDESHIGITEKQPAVGNSDESLWEFFHRHQFFDPVTMESVRPLVVLDQFEEIFTLQRNEAVKKEFFSQLADLINEVTPQYIVDAQRTNIQKPNVDTANQESLDFVLDLVNDEQQETNYVESSDFNLVFVLREDFLSYFERYTAYIPAMKTNRFPLLPINEEQAAEIIMRPREGLVSKDVAKLIIQKVTRNTDFKLDGIPEIEVNATVLSLYLSRLYLKKGSQNTITAEMVDQFSEYIIKDYYEESIAGIPEDEIEKLEDALITYDGKRDNDSLNNLIHEDEKGRIVSKKTINQLVEESKLLRRFSYQGDIRLEFMHDTLCPIINERIKQRKASKLQEEEKAKIRREEELKRQEIEQENQRLEEEAQRIKKRNRNRIKWAITVAAVLTAILAGYLINYFLNEAPYSRTYCNFTTVNGWPVGIHEIDPFPQKDFYSRGNNDNGALDSIVVYYRLTRKGFRNLNPFTKVEVISAHDHKLTTNKFIESPAVGLWNAELSTNVKAKDFADLQKKTAYWIYSPSEQDTNKGSKIAGKCTAFGMDSTELYSVQFNKDNTHKSSDNNKNKYVQWAVYYDASGEQMMITDNGIDRMRQDIDNGKISKCLFFSALGVPQQNERGAYGYEYITNDTTHLLQKKYRVDKFGNQIKEAPITYLDYKYGRTKKTSLYDVLYPNTGKVVKRYKSFSDSLTFYSDSICVSLHPDINRSDSIISYCFDDIRRPVNKQIQTQGKLLYSEDYSYDGKNKEIHKTEDGDSYTERHICLNNSTDIVELWQNEKRITRLRVNEKSHQLIYHSCITTHKAGSININGKIIPVNVETKKYLDTDGNLIITEKNKDVNNYSKFITYRDRLDNIRLVYYFDQNNRIQKSEWFHYDKYGNVVAKSVAGIEFSPVRCHEWSWESFSYYKMNIYLPVGQSLFDPKKEYSYISLQGINEFEENSLVIRKDNDGYYDYSINECVMDYKRIPGIYENSTYVTLSKTSIKEKDLTFSAYFIHILSSSSTLYSAGLKDGDVIISINSISTFPVNTSDAANAIETLKSNKGCDITVARANPESKNYLLIHKTIPDGLIDAHIHQIILTDNEYKRLYNSK